MKETDMLDGLARIRTHGGAVLTLSRVGESPLVGLNMEAGPFGAHVILDADDVDALADAFKVLSDELADRVRPGD